MLGVDGQGLLIDRDRSRGVAVLADRVGERIVGIGIVAVTGDDAFEQRNGRRKVVGVDRLHRGRVVGVLGFDRPVRLARIGGEDGDGSADQQRAGERQTNETFEPSVHDSLLFRRTRGRDPAVPQGVISASAGIPGLSTPSGFLTVILMRNTRFTRSFFVCTLRGVYSASEPISLIAPSKRRPGNASTAILAA